MKYIDIHCHLQFEDYKHDLSSVLARMEEKNTYGIIVGVDFESSKKAVEIAKTKPYLYATIGLHPVNLSQGFDETEYARLIEDKKVVGIGECGFDFHHHEYKDTFNLQREIFIKQIDFAKKYNKPIMLHLRNDFPNKYSAYKEALKILEEDSGKVRANAHFFAGTKEEAKEFISMGHSISFTGVITFAKLYEDLVSSVPIEKIMSETDSPYVAPEPFRGRRAEPPWVSFVTSKIADIKSLPREEVALTLFENAKRFWNLD